MSNSIYPTLSTTIPLYNILIDHVEDVIENEEIESEDKIESTISSTSENKTEQNKIWCKLIKDALTKCKKNC